ncbi:MAG: cytochrome P450, partial [Actinomycetes bacterium]
MSKRELQFVSGAEGEFAHLEEMRRDPLGLMERVFSECGEVGAFQLGPVEVVLLSGPAANEYFFRAPDEDLDQAAAYPFMTPIFGEGVIFDAPPERRREMLHNQALRDGFMRGHAATIQAEVEAMLEHWGEEGEIDLLDFFAELTIYTSSSCLIGRKFRLNLTAEFSQLYHELERGTDALAYVDPYADIESFRRRDAARISLVALVEAIMQARRANAGEQGSEDQERDLLDVLMSLADEDGQPRFSADQVTGVFISMMFAGHHTTSTTASWAVIELLRDPQVLAATIRELDELYAYGAEVSYQALREMPMLDGVLKETLRLHPPLVLVLRKATKELSFAGITIPEGSLVASSIYLSNRLESAFVDPLHFDPARYDEARGEDVANPWSWIPFGAGRHRCVGAAFA